MFRLLSRIICLAVIAIIAFFVLSFTSGGEKFRWFGTTVKEKSEEVGEKADSLKQESEKVMKGVEKAKGTIDSMTGKKNEKSR